LASRDDTENTPHCIPGSSLELHIGGASMEASALLNDAFKEATQGGLERSKHESIGIA
jgi:hypothetical protein